MDHERNTTEVSQADQEFIPRESLACKSSDSDSASDNRHILSVCNGIMKEIDDALEHEKGWARKDAVITACLHEVDLSLKHWKNSIRYCTMTNRTTGSEEDDEVRRWLESVEKHEHSLIQTIRIQMEHISEGLDNFRTFCTEQNDKTNESLRKDLIDELDTSVECLAIQLLPLSTYADLTSNCSQEVEEENDWKTSVRGYTTSVRGYTSSVRGYTNTADYPFEIDEIVWILEPGRRAPMGEFRITEALPKGQFRLAKVSNGVEHPNPVESRYLRRDPY